MYEKTKSYIMMAQIAEELNKIGVDPFTPNKYWVDDPTREYGYFANNLYEIATNAIKDDLIFIGCKDGIGFDAKLQFALNLDGEIKQNVYDILKQYPLPDQVQYAFYEGHITFKQYNQLMKQAQGGYTLWEKQPHKMQF